MKISIKNTLLLIAMHVMLMNSAMASKRVDSVIDQDSETILDSIQQKKMEMSELQSDVDAIDNHLALTKKGQVAYLKFEIITGTLVAVGIVIGSYKTRFPPGLRAMLAAYTSVLGVSYGMIKLSKKDTRIFIKQVGLLNERLRIANDKLDAQSVFYCKKVTRYHPLCGK